MNILFMLLTQHSRILNKLRATMNEKQLIQYIRSFISPLFSMAFFCMSWARKPYDKKLSYSKKLIKIALNASQKDQRYRKIERSKNWNSI